VDERGDKDLNFRLYGALFGMQLYEKQDLNRYSERAVRQFLSVEMDREVGDSAHSTINKVMFATAVNPMGYKRTDVDGTITI
jgi:hypothetical protein